MHIEIALAGAGKPADNGARRSNPVVVQGYPKSEPVLESSYLFPKVESIGVWHYNSPSIAGSVSSDK